MLVICEKSGLALPAILITIANSLTNQPGSPHTALLPFALLSLLANPCEEIGWRGFALTRLDTRYPPFLATLIVAILWALWHLPLFLLPEGIFSMANIPPLPWCCALIARTFLIHWFFRATGRSLTIASAYHLSTNLSAAILGIHSWPALAIVESIAALTTVMVRPPPTQTAHFTRLIAGLAIMSVSVLFGQATKHPFFVLLSSWALFLFVLSFSVPALTYPAATLAIWHERFTSLKSMGPLGEWLLRAIALAWTCTSIFVMAQTAIHFLR